MTTTPKHDMYIGGQFVQSLSGKTREVINPATEEVIALVPEATEEDVNLAVKAARKAFDQDGWRHTTQQERARLLFALAAAMKENATELATLEVQNNGKPMREAVGDVEDAINCVIFYAGLATKIHGETMSVPANSISYVVREPLGVCGQIIPWNFPTLMCLWKICPAVAAGNAVVLKPSEITPLTALFIAKLIDKVGFPKGVVNIITGDGAVAGNTLTLHPQVDKIAFTGGTKTGKGIMINAAQSLKKITLELGGKNSVLIFDDCNFDLTVDWAAFAGFANQGQVCSAGSILLIQDSIYDRFVKALVEKVSKIKVGNGMDESNTMGAIVSKTQLEKIESYINIGKQEGAKLLCGGARKSGKGFFLEPTIFGDVNKKMRIAREEIFGPVLSLIRFKTMEEAIAIANDSEYGLAAGVFTENLTTAHKVLRELRCGITWANSYHSTFNEMPWGGYKQSGTGRELGLYGIQAYLETKQININLDTTPVGWY